MEDLKANDKRSYIDNLIDFFRKRSIWILHYCTGCGAVELPPSMTSRWDIERFGIVPMATPRQADVLLVTGYVSLKTLKRIIKIYEQMPEPKWVLAFGSCTVNGGIYWDSYNTITNLAEYIPVDITVSGCMPRPEAVIDALQTLMEMIQSGEGGAYKKYKENYEYYKKNQDRVLRKEAPILGSSETESIYQEKEGNYET
ncbi:MULTISPECIES: NuoB/complex I 20 kDa subunit family protein [Thermoanaerobacteraceae]|uniref:NADH-quinone oxidoreductase, B subunit n=3 Tax=Thermoanaerobacteraceae TaxID=186814 RepID=I9KTR5_9THEO|nr:MULTISPECIES: NADH-quinone oxidoreductase subunit B [Thermoanaerobacteraceae]EIW00256.1 NADH-quinone oxidoreductase, B subunit [Thermoanaerobacter siderophilus SR4]ERM91217.1 NADH ubiquinone oxidoreductase [Caldanaerobacter subterraneus subsp. yonseiensis KB-1]NNG68154.1 NADH-quinone oxidoreductase subunit B [Caldanaerobacter subterraneus]